MNIRQLSNKFIENGSLIKSNIKNSSIKLLDKKKLEVSKTFRIELENT